jgi:hypothetical protein
MKNDEMARVWREHFPTRHNDPASDQVCRLICALLLVRARHVLLLRRRNNPDKLKRALQDCQIKGSEFADVVLTHPALKAQFRSYSNKVLLKK